MKRALGLAVLCLFLWPAGEGRASEPTGLYVLVKKVEFGPKGAEKAEWIKIEGVFMNEIDRERESPMSPVRRPRKGWMHFTLVKGKEDLCRLEWQDLMRVAGTDQAVAFGSSHANRFHEYDVSRAVADKAEDAKPLPHPLGHGMYLLRKDSEPDQKLKAAK